MNMGQNNGWRPNWLFLFEEHLNEMWFLEFWQIIFQSNYKTFIPSDIRKMIQMDGFPPHFLHKDVKL